MNKQSSKQESKTAKNSENKPLNMVIVGGGTAGWMAANLFANKWSSEQVQVTLVESPDVGIIGVGEGSTPTLKRFFELLNISESEWMPRCNATYKMNIRFDDWSPKSGINSYSHPFTSQVDVFTSRAFLVNGRTRRLGLDVNTNPADFLINSVLAEQGKGPLTPDNFPFKMEYSYHFDSSLLGEFLAEFAASKGIIHKKAHIEQVQRANNGDISAIVTHAGEVISGDFFVDCTGFSALLIQKTLGVKFNSYKDNLFNNAVVVMPTTISEKIPVETTSTALSNGWCWKIPLTNRFGNGYVYSNDFISADAAETELRTYLGCLNSDVQARHLKMNVGSLEQHWSHNCLALGLSQGFIEPLEATALHLVQLCIEMFISKFEQGGLHCLAQHQQGREQYNSLVKQRFERVRDYIVAHYKLNTRDDSDYWRANRNNQHLSDSLMHILDVWYKREDLAAEIERQQLNNHFDAVSWQCLLGGYGAFPPLAPNQPNKGDLYKEQNIQQFLQGCALNFSLHQDNLSSL